MSSIPKRIEAVRSRINEAAQRFGRNPDDIRLLAVSKTRPVSDIRVARSSGLRLFGENYLQDAIEKQRQLKDLDLEWHYIGRLQSNKTAAVAASFQWVHGLSSMKHAQRLNDQRPEEMAPLDACLQVNVSGEASKGGVAPDELPDLANQISTLPKLRLRGLMALPEPTDDFDRQRESFAQVRGWRDKLNASGLKLDTLSMGMSADLEAAIAEGATIVRIGTALFGPRK